MKKLTIFLLVGCFVPWIGLNFVGCSSTPTAAAPTTITQYVPIATPYCGSPTSAGLTTIGATTFGDAGGNIFANPVTFAASEVATSISLYVPAGPVTGQIRFAIYTDNTAAPKSLVVETSPQYIVASSWNTATLPNIYLPIGTYWMAFISSDSFSVKGTTPGGNEYSAPNGWGVFPTTAPGGSTATVANSLYITVCP